MDDIVLHIAVSTEEAMDLLRPTSMNGKNCHKGGYVHRNSAIDNDPDEWVHTFPLKIQRRSQWPRKSPHRWLFIARLLQN